jgi:hypothetical protein
MIKHVELERILREIQATSFKNLSNLHNDAPIPHLKSKKWLGTSRGQIEYFAQTAYPVS